jgi:hypothetical protein
MTSLAQHLRPDTPTLAAWLRCRHGCRTPATLLVEFDDTGCLCWPDPLQALCHQHALKGLEAAWPNGRVVARLEWPR